MPAGVKCLVEHPAQQVDREVGLGLAHAEQMRDDLLQRVGLQIEQDEQQPDQQHAIAVPGAPGRGQAGLRDRRRDLDTADPPLWVPFLCNIPFLAV